MPLPNILEFIGTNISQRNFQQAQEKLLNFVGEIDQRQAATANGYFKSYATLAAANADIANIPLGVSVKVMSVEEGGEYYKATAGATSVTKSPYDPATSAKADATTKANAAKIEAVSQVVTLSSNLFNAETITKNKTISSAGILTDTTNFACSDFIQVTPSTVYYFDGFRSVAFYDENKVFVSRTNVVASGAGTAADPYKYTGLITTGTNVYFIRVNYNMIVDTDYVDGRKININASAPYEKYANKLKEVTFVNNPRSLADKVVTKSKVDFIQESSNLFNAATAIAGKVILDTGVVSDNAGYALSDFIAVKGGEKYTISCETGVVAFTNASYYDVNKQFIRRVATSIATLFTFRLPEDVAYVRFNINLSSGAPSQKNRMFNIGDTALPFEAWYTPKLIGIESPASMNEVRVREIVTEEIEGLETISSYVDSSYNLFDSSKCTVGYAYDVSGNIVVNAAYAISDFIAVTSSGKYTISGLKGKDAFIYTMYFDANKQFIRRDTTGSSTNGFLYITTPINAAYVRFNINVSSTGQPSESERMFTAGHQLKQYIPHRKELVGLNLSSTATKDLGREIKLQRPDNIMYTHNIDRVFTTTNTFGDHLSFNSSTSAQVYQMYDDLLTVFPNYITKKFLGNDAWGNPIALYKFKAPQPTAVQSTRMPKVFITSGVHGMEHVAVLTAYLTLKELCENWKSSELLTVLKQDVEFLIIPVCNPSGYNKYTRKNDNGVDINRNFPDGFGWQATDPASAYYGGAAPLDQLESQYIVRVFEENPDIDIMYDFHNYNGTSAALHPHLIWIAAYKGGQYVEHMVQKLVKQMTNHWRSKFTWIPQEDTWYAGYSDTTEGAMIKDYAAKTRGIPFTATFEVGGKWWIDPTGVPFDLNHKQCTVEAFVNFLLINLEELKRI